MVSTEASWWWNILKLKIYTTLGWIRLYFELKPFLAACRAWKFVTGERVTLTYVMCDKFSDFPPRWLFWNVRKLDHLDFYLFFHSQLNILFTIDAITTVFESAPPFFFIIELQVDLSSYFLEIFSILRLSTLHRIEFEDFGTCISARDDCVISIVSCLFFL